MPEPLAAKLRPKTLDEFVGQAHLVGEGKPLRLAMERRELFSFVLWGPPGVGKTTLARIYAKAVNAEYHELSAVSAGKDDIRQIVEKPTMLGQPKILFLDEIHRFNKAQQDFLLPHVESGKLTLIGATTENPSFEVNAALLSRLRVQVLKELSSENLVHILSRAQAEDAQLQGRGVKLNGATLEIIATQSQGDARKALNVLEYISLSGAVKSGDEQNIDEAQFQKLMQKAILYHDKSGHQHYDAISALHKSIRNSDVDASLYWLARMLEAGDEPLYVARRLVRFASEDIGLADNRALSLALDAKEAAHFMGMPECELALAQAVVFMALAPKNNSLYESYGRVKKSLQEGEIYPVPYHLRNAVTKFDSKVGFGKGYEYAHDHPEQVAEMECLPEPLLKKLPNRGQGYYYVPKKIGSEAALVELWQQRRRKEEKPRGEKKNES
jgi:putative ATPase